MSLIFFIKNLITSIKIFLHSFAFDACFKMENDAGTKTGLRLKYAIEEKLYKDHPIRRVRFEGGSNNVTGGVIRDVHLGPEEMGFFQCTREVVYLKVITELIENIFIYAFIC